MVIFLVAEENDDNPKPPNPISAEAAEVWCMKSLLFMMFWIF
jgi:hypothetical protein